MYQVIILPELVPSASTCLGSALRELGHRVKILSRYTHRFGFKADEYVIQKRSGNVLKFFKHIYAGRYLFSRYNIVHFNYGSTLFDPGFGSLDAQGASRKLQNHVLRFLQTLEITVLRLRKIPIFVHFQGDDAVQGDRSLAMFQDSIAAHVDSNYYTRSSDLLKRKRIEWFDTFADDIFCVSPDMKWFLPERSKFIPYACTKILELTPMPRKFNDSKLRVCHAPSDREVKGTSFLYRAVSKLRGEGFSIEIEILENMAHDEVLKRIAECDVFVDQLHHGWYGGVAVEAMALGKPVICFIRETDLIFLPDSMAQELPIINSDPNTIAETLKSLLSLPNSTLVELGVSSRRFVENWHDPIKIANQILDHYDKAVSREKLVSGNRR